MMKQLLAVLFLVLSWQYTFAQLNPEERKIILLGQSDGQKISLRWSLTDFDSWQEGNNAGYEIIRYTTHLNGVRYTQAEIQNSQVIIQTSLMPLLENEWDIQFPGNNFAMVAKGALYEDDPTTILSGSPTLADAINLEQSKEARVLFGLFAAEQDFEVAKGMALGLEDPSVQAGYTYSYMVKLNSSNPDFTGIYTPISISTNDIVSLPPVEEVQGEGMDRVILIQYDMEAVRAFYSSYDIERSLDGVNFTKVNDLPFVFGVEGNSQPEYAVYRDSIADNNTLYHYRVRGRSPFGVQGPPSQVISLTGKPPRLSLFLNIDSVNSDQNNVTINWDDFDATLESDIQGFNVYRSLQADQLYEQINTALLTANTRSFVDANPLPNAYYKLEAIDDNDYDYLSTAKLVQLNDSIPPDVPSGLTGSFITGKRVKINWEANTEEDLKGYRVFAANGLMANYTQLTKSAIRDEEFIYEVDPSFLVDSIYFKVLAADKRDNYSDKTLALALARPDIIPPATPNLYKVSPTPAGVEIGFKFSSSADRVKHELERKRKNAPGWEVILTIPQAEETNFAENLSQGSITATCFIDSTILERRDYQYRFLAYDDNNNVSSSEIIDVRPFDNGTRGTIEAFQVYLDCAPAGEIPQLEAFETLERIRQTFENDNDISLDSLELLVYWNIITTTEFNELSSQEFYDIYLFLNNRKTQVWGANLIASIELSWIYEEDDQLQDFQIFRSVEGSALSLYKTLRVDDLIDNAYLDEDVRPGRRYFYQIMARHLDGGFSERSNTLMVNVPSE